MSRSILYIVGGALAGILLGFLINFSGFILFTNIGLNFGILSNLLSLVIVAGSIGAFLGLFIRDVIWPSTGNKYVSLIIALIISAIYGVYFLTVLHPRDLKEEMYYKNLIQEEGKSIQQDRESLDRFTKCLNDATSQDDKDICDMLYGPSAKVKVN